MTTTIQSLMAQRKAECSAYQSGISAQRAGTAIDSIEFMSICRSNRDYPGVTDWHAIAVAYACGKAAG
jgi:hypothetical protein